MTVELPADLQRLDDFLMSDAVADDAMLLSELDGFLAGLHVSPSLILPSEWFPLIWGEDETLFASEEEAGEAFDLVMRRYNAIADELAEGTYSAILGVDPVKGDVVWEMWADGFRCAVSLRQEEWADLFESDRPEEFLHAAFALLRLGVLATTPANELEPHEGDAGLEEAAEELISPCVAIVYHFVVRLGGAGARDGDGVGAAGAAGAPKRRSGRKIGRNEPCPCGSGRKYKNCCLGKDQGG
ncbi:MAG: UPF0149 family protein [Azospirillaceae bacterium]